jgi:phospholipid-binding lipoprotein MlaA
MNIPFWMEQKERLMKDLQRRACALLAATALIGLNGCASMGVNTDPRDPFESLNRNTYKFNQGMDKALFHPFARLYQAITPSLIDEGISNIFSNINDVVVVVNDILQFKLRQAVYDLSRLAINSTLGLGGFFDVATGAGLEKHNEDFGQTLARWGIHSGPYVIVPFLGPSTIRDVVGYGVDSALVSPIAYVPEPAHQAGLLSMNYIDYKSDAQSTGSLVEEAALDEYDFTKSAYLSRRENLIEDKESGAGEFEDFEDPATSPE